jgi:thioester reductase-like protein
MDGVDVRLEAVPSLGHDPNGEPARGQILVSTPHLIGGYFADGAATQGSFDDDGYFRTGDVGERDPDGSVHVIGRIKSAVKLAQGEFVSPDRIEVELGSSALVDQIYVHVDRHASSLSAVVLPRPRDASATDVLSALRHQAQKAKLASYETPARVLLLTEPMTAESGLLTVSGKLKRTAAAERFAPLLAVKAPSADVSGERGSMLERVVAVARTTTGRPLDPDAPLAEGMVDSLTAAELMMAIGESLGKPVPLSYWFASRTLRELADSMARVGETRGDPAHEEDLNIEPVMRVGEAAPSPPGVVLLTGATGFLGCHILEEVMKQTDARVICLVRGDGPEDAQARLSHALTARGIDGLDAQRIEVVVGDLAAPRLGLDNDLWHRLDAEVDVIFHTGALVSWLALYEQVRAANVLGTCAIIELAAGPRRKPLHFVSTISCAPPDGDEKTTLSREVAARASPYAFSKWIAERHVERAHARGLPVAIYRPAMIAGHAHRGYGNSGDYINRYLEGCRRLGRHLALDDHKLDMTPVDYVASAIVRLAGQKADGRIYHLSNIAGSMSYAALGEALRFAGAKCEPADYASFREAVLASEDNTLRALASYFPADGFALHMGPWPDERTREVLAALGVRCPVIDDATIARYVARMRATP